MTTYEESYCLICNDNITESITISITQCIRPVTIPNLTIYQFLQSITNFNQLDITKVPQNTCEKCYEQISLVLNFQIKCNQTVENLQRASENIQTQEKRRYDDDNDIKEDIVDNFSDDNLGLDNEVNESSQSEEENEEDDDFNEEPPNLKKKYNKDGIPYHSVRVTCKICDKVYARSYMKLHMRAHTGERPYKCKICPKTFKDSGSLTTHMYMHNDVRRFMCNICGARFRLSCGLKTHMYTHTQYPFNCKVCGKKFVTENKCKRHEVIHSDNPPPITKPFQCDQCPKTFRQKKNLTQHMVTHAKVKPIECLVCGRRFTQRHCLRSHQARSCPGRRVTENECVEEQVGEHFILGH